MSVSFEKIEELKKRANVTYEEAKKILEKHNGDIVEALIELEKDKKVCCSGRYSKEGISKLKRLFRKGNQTKFVLSRRGDIVVKVPINYLLLALILGFHLVIVSLVIVFVTGCKMTIKKSEGIETDVDEAIVNVAQKIKKGAVDLHKKHCCDEDSKEDANSQKDYSEYKVE